MRSTSTSECQQRSAEATSATAAPSGFRDNCRRLADWRLVGQPANSPRSSDRTCPASRVRAVQRTKRPPTAVGTPAPLPALEQNIGPRNPADAPDFEGMALGDADFEPHRPRAAPRSRNDTLTLESGPFEEVAYFAGSEFLVHSGRLDS